MPTVSVITPWRILLGDLLRSHSNFRGGEVNWTLPCVVCAGDVSHVSTWDLFGPIAGATNSIMKSLSLQQIFLEKMKVYPSTYAVSTRLPSVAQHHVQYLKLNALIIFRCLKTKFFKVTQTLEVIISNLILPTKSPFWYDNFLMEIHFELYKSHFKFLTFNRPKV